jgi:predicted ATPase
MKLHVITGGPGVGKTTVLELLSEKGYAIIPEAARMIIEEESTRGSDVLPWKNLEKFQAAVANQQLKTEMAASADINFLDRSLVDGYVYCMIGKIPAPKALLNNVRNRYEKVFMLEPLDLYVKDKVRIEGERLAKRIHNETIKAYIHFGYEPIIVPVLSPEERAAFILKQIFNKKPPCLSRTARVTPRRN